jgi:NAD+ diphosphatase
MMSACNTPSKHARKRWLLFHGHSLLVTADPEMPSIPSEKEVGQLGVSFNHAILAGIHDGCSFFAAEIQSPVAISEHMVFRETRSLHGLLGKGVFEIALAGLHLLEWNRVNQYCPTCKGSFRLRTDIRAKECEACGSLQFPRISPAIIVLIEKDDSILLARSARFAGKFFSVLAGFVEPGENLEEAVRREVQEEVGISIKDIRYFGSQPWPFPDSLMIGFTAHYASGEIKVDEEEIIEAGWYNITNLPNIPGKESIARKLIDSFIEKSGSRKARGAPQKR